MKYFIVLIAIVAVASAARRGPSPLAKAVAASVRHAESEDGILSKSFDINEDGSYAYQYQTSSGITASENGVGGQYAKGAVEYTSPEGERVILQYTADENGYQPVGSHVPQTPDYIIRALEYIRTHPNPKYQNF